MFCVSGLSEELDGYGFDRRNDVGGFDGRENTNSPFASPFHQVLSRFIFDTCLLILTIWFWTHSPPQGRGQPTSAEAARPSGVATGSLTISQRRSKPHFSLASPTSMLPRRKLEEESGRIGIWYWMVEWMTPFREWGIHVNLKKYISCAFF